MNQIPQGKKLVYSRLDIEIAIGSTSFSKPGHDIRSGQCVGVKIIDFSEGTKRQNAVNVTINDTSGSALVGATDHRDFIGTGGGYLESFKPVSFSTTPQIDISVVSTELIATAAYKAQMIFAILVDDHLSN